MMRATLLAVQGAIAALMCPAPFLQSPPQPNAASAQRHFQFLACSAGRHFGAHVPRPLPCCGI